MIGVSVFRDGIVWLRHWVGEAVRVQLLMVFCSFPVLNAWGLPTSPLALVGNLLCAPVALVFLAFGFFFLVGSVVGLPVRICATFLNGYVAWWHWLLAAVGPVGMWGFPAVPALVAWGGGLLSYGVVYFWAGRIELRRELVLYGVGIACWVAVASLFVRSGTWHIPDKGFRRLSVLYDDRSARITVCDPGGALPRERSVSSWGMWTLQRELVRAYGVYGQAMGAHVDLVLLRPTKASCVTAAALLEQGWIGRVIATHRPGLNFRAYQSTFGDARWVVRRARCL